MPYVTERWLGGTLTNFRTIRDRLKRLEELERIEQSGDIDHYSKKMESQLRREKTKILRNLEGIREMHDLPKALVIVDVKREVNAVKEAQKLGIPTVGLIDTDSDPDLVDIAIPGNDDAMRSIEVVVDSLCKAVMEGKAGRAVAAEGFDAKDQASADGAGTRRRSSRARFRADEPAETQSTDESSASEQVAPPAEADAPATSETVN